MSVELDALAVLDMGGQCIEQMTGVIGRHLDGLPVHDRQLLYDRLDQIETAAAGLRATINALTLLAGLATGDSVYCELCGDLVFEGDLAVHHRRQHT